jgi:hypothetical protein
LTITRFEDTIIRASIPNEKAYIFNAVRYFYSTQSNSNGIMEYWNCGILGESFANCLDF